MKNGLQVQTHSGASSVQLGSFLTNFPTLFLYSYPFTWTQTLQIMEWLTSSIKSTTQGISGGLNIGQETTSPSKGLSRSSKGTPGSEASSNKNSSGKSKQSQEEDASLSSIKVTEEMIEYVGMLASHHETFLNFPLEHLEGGEWQHEVDVVQQQLIEVMIKNQRKNTHCNSFT